MQQPEVLTQPPTPAQAEAHLAWWSGLSQPWKTAFNEITLRRTSDEQPPLEILHQLRNTPVLRFAGPTAPFPNMSFELDNLDGITALDKLEIFVFTFHRLRHIEQIAHLTQIKSLFLFNNHLTSLEGIEGMSNLEELYFNVNQIDSLRRLEHLTNLKSLYCNYNRLTSLDGIGKQHLGTLTKLVCLPNDKLPDSEVIRMEREIGIRCLTG